jgi:cullin 3
VLYRNAYTLVLHKDGEKLYNAAKQVVAAHLTQVAGGGVYAAYQDLVHAPGTRDYEKQDAGVRFLKVVRDAWEDHTLCMKMIRDVLMYLVRRIYNDRVDSRIAFMSSKQMCRLFTTRG